jgi:DNA-binding MarR family transcriptional regulator
MHNYVRYLHNMSAKRQLLHEELMQNISALRKAVFSPDSRLHRTITPQQWVVMRIIAHTPDCTVKDIAAQMQITSSAATQLVDKLEQGRFISRKENSKDRRAIHISLSKKTESEVKKLKMQMRSRLTKVFSVLSEKELEQFVTIHKKIVDQIFVQNNKKNYA